MKRNSPAPKGFTLIELMVSVAIFAIIMVISLGALLSISAADRKAETVASVMNNLNFAVESMSRNIRTGSDYRCGLGAEVSCPNGAALIRAFNNGIYADVIYSFSVDPVICGQPTGTVGCIARSTDAGATYVALTAPEVVISKLTFYLRGAKFGSSGDNVQPNVVITVTGYVQISVTQKSSFNLQTSVTQRLYDR